MQRKILVNGLMIILLLVTSCKKKTKPGSVDEGPDITYKGTPRIKNFEVKNLEGKKTKLIIEVEGKDVELGSFFVRLVEEYSEGGNHLENFYKDVNGYWFLNAQTLPDKSANLVDNGVRDEDNRKNVFAYTFDSEKWPESMYSFICGWHNRPQPGAYILAAMNFALLDGRYVGLIESFGIESPVHRIVYKEEGVYAAFPDLFVMPNQLLGTSFSTKTESRNHIDPVGGSKVMTSADYGKTWTSSTALLVDQKWKMAKGDYVLPLAKGWIYVDASMEAELRQQQRIISAVSPGKIAYLGGAWVRTSSDEGKTWQSKDIPIPDDCSGLMNHHTGAAYAVTTSKVRLRATYGRRKSNATNTSKDEIYFIRSEDDGMNWTCQPMYPNGLSGLEITGLNETAIIEAQDGSIVAMMRSVPEGYLWQAVSKDAGKTWSQPINTKIWGFPADLIKLKDGRLLCAYGYRKGAMGIRAVVSSDNGKTWSIDKEMIIRGDGQGFSSDLGYPIVYELADGSIFCIYYITTDGTNTHIASTTFKIPF